ncbi:MAG TPA: DUF1648 domain-containing protein [Candidatus Cybelea sp.]
MALFWFFLGGTIVAVTVVLTSRRYAQLPDRIPIHFGLMGDVDGYGPRFLAWLLVFVQLGVAVQFLLLSAMARHAGVVAAGDAILGICLAAQLLILNTARSGKTRANMLGFWIFLAAMIAGCVIAVGRR